MADRDPTHGDPRRRHVSPAGRLVHAWTGEEAVPIGVAGKGGFPGDAVFHRTDPPERHDHEVEFRLLCLADS